MTHPRQAEIDRHWASYFQCNYQQFIEPGILLHPRSDNCDEVFLFQHGQTSLVLIPPEVLDRVASLFGNRLPSASQLATGLEKYFGTALFREVEAGFKFYLDPAVLAPRRVSVGRLLSPQDAEHFERLRASCSQYDWDMAEIHFNQPDMMGYFEGDALAAAASFSYLGEPALIADIHLITHPQFRRQGLGRLLAEDLIRLGLRQNMIVQWDAESRNDGSISLARSIGFERYAFMQRLLMD